MSNANPYLGVIGLFAVVMAGLGTTYVFTAQEADNTYRCSANDDVGVFYGGLSSTGVTAYPEVKGVGGKRCTGGSWIRVDPVTLMPFDVVLPELLPDNPSRVIQFECPTDGPCRRKVE
jgi:hypothetical protein